MIKCGNECRYAIAAKVSSRLKSLHSKVATICGRWTVISLLFVAQMSSAEDEIWRYAGKPLSEHFDTVEISSNPQNFTIQQDKKGFIYVGNGNGLLIYDGYNWQVLSLGDQQSVRDYVLANDGRIYTGSAGQIGYFEADAAGQWAFQSLLGEAAATPTITGIYCVLEVNQYIVFVSQSHLFYYTPDTGLQWFTDAINPLDLVADGDQLLVSTQDSVIFSVPISSLGSPDAELSTVAVKYESDGEVAGGFVALANGRVLVHSADRLYVRDKSGRFVPFETETDQWLVDNTIQSVLELPDGRLAIGTLRGGMAILSEGGQLLRFYNANHGLSDSSVNNMFLDRDKSFWISSSSNGVSRVELDSAISYFPSSDEYFISASTTEFDGRIFMGAQYGLFVLELADSPLQQAEFGKLDFELDHVLSFVPDSDQLLVAHSAGVSVLSFDGTGRPRLRMVHDGSEQNGGRVRAIARLSLHPDIALAISPNGVVKLQKVDDRWASKGLLPGFDEDIFSIQEDAAGSVWLGSKTGRFYRVDDIGEWPNVVTEIDYLIPDTPTYARVLRLDEYVLLNNGDGEVIPTLSEGSTHFEPARIADWNDQNIDGLIKVHQIVPDRAWFLSWSDELEMDRAGQLERLGPGRYGIDFSVLDRLDLQFTLGLYQGEAGTVWINSKGKVVRYDAQNGESPRGLSRPVLTKIVDIGTEDRLYVNNGFEHQIPEIRLGASNNAISIEYSAVDFVRLRSIQYRHRLSGNRSGWSGWHRKTNAIYTNVGSGMHEFELQYRTAPNRVSPVSVVSIRRDALWYQSIWVMSVFALLAVATVLTFGFLIAGIKNRKLTSQARLLESEVAQRTSVIQQQNVQLTEQNLKMEELDNAKSRFFSNISHEFLTPLTLAIAPIKDVLAAGRVEDERDKGHLTMALENNLHMRDLLGQVLDINKLESSSMPIRVMKLDLVSDLERFIRRFDLVAEKRNIQLRKKGFKPGLTIYFDPDHFEKVMLNLLSNAIKYSPVDSAVEISIHSGSDSISIEITDQGFGIDPEDLPHIFDRYYRGTEPTHTLQPATGIGLALVKELLSLHRAEISVESVRGERSTFTATILTGCEHYDHSVVCHDLAVPSPDADRVSRSLPGADGKSDAPRDTQNSGLKKLLIVDDDADFRRFVRGILEANYDVVEAENGLVGLERARDGQPDLIISDVMMPAMDGFQLTQELKSAPSTAHIPLILLTAKSTTRDTVDGLSHGADDYLSKPFDSTELVARIEAQLAQKRRIARKLYAELFSETNTERFTSEYVDKFSKQLDELLVNKMGDERFDVDQMCQGLNVTRSTLFRHTKKHFGVTPRQLLKNRRLEASSELLRRGQGTISEIAYAVGFQSLSSYSRAFSDHFGVPPTRYEELASPLSQ